MEKTIYFIESQYEEKGEWFLEHSYDFNFFHEYQQAKDFLEENFDIMEGKRMRIASYTRNTVIV